MKNIWVYRIAAAALLLGVSTAANAGALVTATFTGVIDTAIDPNGLFGGDAQIGDAVSWTVVFQDSAPVAGDTSNRSLTWQVNNDEYPSPELDNNFTLDGHTVRVPDNNLFEANSFVAACYSSPLPYCTPASYSASVGGGNIQNAQSTDGLAVYAPLDFDPPTLDQSFEASSSGGYGFFGLADGTYIHFGVSNVEVSAAPELSVWAYMIAGVSVAGCALRRRRRLSSHGCLVEERG